MPKIRYQDFNFRTSTLLLIQSCNELIEEMMADGYKLTLRQLYYLLVARDLFGEDRKYVRLENGKWRKDPINGTINAEPNYDWLGNTISDARLAGMIDWDAIEDRTRALKSVSHWDDPTDIIASVAHSYRIDKWKDQPFRVEVWIEKDALGGVFERICRSLDVPWLSCRGYTSQSEMWGAAMRFVQHIKQNKHVIVLHFGDHDPSGIDMTRDIEDRLRMFVAGHVSSYKVERLTVKRIALNMDQVRKYDPPENPAKTSDTRFQKYQDEFGDSSWELDALKPQVLAALVRAEVEAIRDDKKWNSNVNLENADRAKLQVISDNWEEIDQHVESSYGLEIEEHLSDVRKIEDEIEEEEEDDE
jgi:hypothetical protein